MNDVRTRVYVTHLLDNGSNVTEDIANRSVKNVKPRKDSFGFIIFERLEYVYKGITLTSEPTYVSGTYYTKGELLTRVELYEKYPEEYEVHKRMGVIEETTGEAVKVLIVNNNYYAFTKKDRMYDASKIKR